MDIKKLNEELDRILMSEISQGLKNKVRDTRKANYLAAQATADMAQSKADKLKAKYDKINSKVAIDKTEYKNISKSVDKEVQKLFKRGYSSLYNIDGIYMIEVKFYGDKSEDITPTALQQLQELLEKMTDTYGLKYSYEVKDDQIIITCEQPQNYTEPDLISQLKDGTFDRDSTEGLYVIYKNLDNLSVDDIAKMMEVNQYNYLFPSEWKLHYRLKDFKNYDEDFQEFVREGYPEKFAQALIKTEDKDSLGDIWNIYYSRTVISDGAVDVFQKDAIKNMRTYLPDWMGEITSFNDDGTVKLDDMYMEPVINHSEKLYRSMLKTAVSIYPQYEEGLKEAFEDLHI